MEVVFVFFFFFFFFFCGVVFRLKLAGTTDG
jgi:hypothetical protein